MNNPTLLKSFFTAGFLLTAAIGYGQNTNSALTEQKAIDLYEMNPTAYKSDDVYHVTWPTLDEKNVVWKKRVWRTIDLSATGNELLNTPVLGASLGEVLCNGLLNGQLKGYSAVNDRFTTVLNTDMLKAIFSPSADGKYSGLKPADIKRIAIKEDWLYIASEHKLVARIIGIAPIITTTDKNGIVSEQPAFWVYYPDARPLLAGQTICSTIDETLDNLDKVLEGRHFSAPINKISGTITRDRRKELIGW